LSDLPSLCPDEVLDWLYDCKGDDQWVGASEGGNLADAGLREGTFVTVWQDEPLTDSDKQEIAEDAEVRMARESLWPDCP
jgi:hypothetical protein